MESKIGVFRDLRAGLSVAGWLRVWTTLLFAR
jgi:hypothetical protein